MKYTLYTIADNTITAQEIESPEHDGYLMGVHLEELSRHGGEYAKTLRGWAHALWAGTADYFQAWVGYNENIRIGLTAAWRRGSAECGINPEDFTPKEKETRDQIIASEQLHIRPFLLWVAQNNKKSGTKRGVITARTVPWGLRYDDVMTRARLMACANKSLEWVQGPTSDQCKTCTRMNGKVKRASQWQRSGVHPRAPKNNTIQCQGWRCLCELVPTDKPLSRGPLPRWP